MPSMRLCLGTALCKSCSSRQHSWTRSSSGLLRRSALVGGSDSRERQEVLYSGTYHCKMTWLGETVEVSRYFPEP